MAANCPRLDLASRSRSDLRGIGGEASAETIADKVAPRVVLLRPDNEAILVCLDREGRGVSAADFAADIRTALVRKLRSMGESADSLTVVVADRAFEAWLLADLAGLCRRKRVAQRRRRCYEGYQNGASDYGVGLLRRHFGRYHKTIDGPQMFSLVNLGIARIPCTSGRGWGSASLDCFLRALDIQT